MNDSIVIELLASGILYGTPLLIAALGELLAERSGVLNLGVEGMMLMGAVSGYWASQTLGWPTPIALGAALVVAGVAGLLMALIHAFVSIGLGGNQIVSGLALTIFAGAAGLSSFYASAFGVGGDQARHAFASVDFLGLGDVPVLGPLLFDQNAMVYISWLLTAAVAVYLYRTKAGLNVRAVGEDPAAADAMGINVSRYRYLHVLAGGFLAGVAGATFSLAINQNWADGLTRGNGWIAIALVIFAFWRPGFVLIGAYMFGTVSSLGFTLQSRGVELPSEIFSALPYVMTIVVLVLVSTVWVKGRLGAPHALGTNYARDGG